MKTTTYFLIISCSVLLRMRNVLDKSCRGNQNTHFVLNNVFFENHIVYEIMWKNTTEQSRLQMSILSLHITCWITKATCTFSAYVTLLFHCNSGCKNTLQRYVVHKLPVLFAFRKFAPLFL